MEHRPIWETQTLITQDKISEFDAIMLENPIVAQCMGYYFVGDISKEEALMSAIKFLVIQNKNMFASLVEYVQRFGKI